VVKQLKLSMQANYLDRLEKFCMFKKNCDYFIIDIFYIIKEASFL